MTDWQDISTAKDAGESRVLLWCADLRAGYPDKTPRPCGVVLGRIVDGEPYGDGMSGDWQFTHWMPLPPAPTVLESE